MRAKQRFQFNGKREAKRVLKKALREGTIIEATNKFSFVVHFEGMFLMVLDGVLKTVFDEAMYRDAKNCVSHSFRPG